MTNPVQKFICLPSDIFRSLATYLSVKDIISLIRSNKKLAEDMYHNQLFRKNMIKLRLTDYEDRITSDINIFGEIRSKNLIIAAKKGYEKKIKCLSSKIAFDIITYKAALSLIIITTKKYNHIDISNDLEKSETSIKDVNQMSEMFGLSAMFTNSDMITKQLDLFIDNIKKDPNDSIFKHLSALLPCILGYAVALGKSDCITYLISVMNIDENIKQKYLEYILYEQ